jgi:hypothetical protein
MLFFTAEIDQLKELFAYEKSDLERDFDEVELKAISNLGVLRHSAHLYLDTNVKFFPSKTTHPYNAELPAAHSCYITCYYDDKRNLDKILPKIFDIMHPNYKISIG